MNNIFPFKDFSTLSPTIISLQSTTSTNDVIHTHYSEFPFVCVRAFQQTKGRGRYGKHWQSDTSDNVCCSIGMEYKQPLALQHGALLQMIGTIAVLQTLLLVEPQLYYKIKYPNDVYIKTNQNIFKKVSGVLLECDVQNNVITKSVLGIGINCNVQSFPTDLQSKATSLFQLTGKHYNPAELMQTLVNKIQELFALSESEIIKQWQMLLDVENKTFTILGNSDEWKFYGFTPEGLLKVQHIQTHQLRTIHDGDSIIYNLE
ncbi:MAG: biotin--[acetyl-CoA-carboxylase] ligase [Candidatus Kapaibacterium sp.]|nr:biotin--[acetyl-CoA-carboxylase] ligase [Bacteroidota bacterium]